MDDRITEFARGLRAAGVRVSVAESADALLATRLLGIQDKETFRDALRTTLVKEGKDFPVFDKLFPLYFGSGGQPLQDATEDLTPGEQNMLQQALESFDDRLQQLLDWLTSGDGPTPEELQAMAQETADRWADSPHKAMWVTQSMLREMGFSQLEQKLQELIEKLQQMGMSQESIENLLGIVRTNATSLREQVAEAVGLEVQRERSNRPSDLNTSDIMHKPFGALSEADVERLRIEIRKLVNQLRSRVALRHKRGKDGRFDPKGTIRANLRYGGVPVELKFKRNKLKPSLVLLMDVSRSMEPVVEFMLRLMYELNDQISKIRLFAYYADLTELDPHIATMIGNDQVDDAFFAIRHIHPYQPYATDLGNGLETFFHKHLNAVDGRTTVLFLGDGRNNYNASRADLIKELQRRVKRLVWFTPEREIQWFDGDCDMHAYEPYCDSVAVVGNLAQLSAAVDNLLTS
ncbi:MAG: VWA domain-containing protein [Anaerolineae bacterium]|nr:VWA domain-containing protein [Anaerolineae bacterium]MCO5194274.1 VWA domain-containing protein [Anaerolineae bacterium]